MTKPVVTYHPSRPGVSPGYHSVTWPDGHHSEWFGTPQLLEQVRARTSRELEDLDHILTHIRENP